MDKKTFLMLGLCAAQTCIALPDAFVYLQDVDPTIIQYMQYYESNNFIGQRITGYEAPKCILTREAATALKQAQKKLRAKNLSLKVYDCYRPQRAVDEFVVWSKNPYDQKMKYVFYPNIEKKDVFKLNYVAKKSGHSRGSTVDVTIVDLHAHRELDMGARVDYLDPVSHYSAKNISHAAKTNRKLLHDVMVASGFYYLETEWWHFTLIDEPYPQNYFDFVVG